MLQKSLSQALELLCLKVLELKYNVLKNGERWPRPKSFVFKWKLTVVTKGGYKKTLVPAGNLDELH